MNKKILFIALCCIAPNSNQAHQPHIVQSDTVMVENPDVSQAFYASNPACYVINSPEPFTLFVQILRPKINGLNPNITVRIEKEGKHIATLEGSAADWQDFYEPFGNDNYYQGPSITQDAQGAYTINVSGPDKYVLAIGKKEAWPLSVILKTLLTMPTIKIYFEKSPLLAFWNLSGAFLATVILVLSTAGYCAYSVIKRLLKD